MNSEIGNVSRTKPPGNKRENLKHKSRHQIRADTKSIRYKCKDTRRKPPLFVELKLDHNQPTRCIDSRFRHLDREGYQPNCQNLRRDGSRSLRN